MRTNRQRPRTKTFTRKISHASAFTLIEMLTTAATLVIVLGLMVSLARYVRSRSADALTRNILQKLDAWLTAASGDPSVVVRLGAVPKLIAAPDAQGDDELLQKAAMANNEAFVRACLDSGGGGALLSLPLTVYDGRTLRDAWGTPLIYMAPNAPSPGLSPQKRAFFFSAGPDRRFGTVSDNLYSYEIAR